MKTKIFYLLLTTYCLLFVSCGDFKKTNVVAPPSNGKLDFSSFVSLGNSLTAGYQSGALFESAQEWSFPADIAKETGASNFVQPLMPNPGTGALMSITSLSGPVINKGNAIITLPTNASLTRPFNNLGIPGAVLYDLIDTSDFSSKSQQRQNPFFSLVLRNKLFGSSPVAQALKLNPTFMSVWIGANDVLGYATSGGTVGTGGPGTGPTDANVWAYLYTQTMSALLAGAPNAKFVVANIPDVTAIPFFTTILPFVYGTNGEPIVFNGSHVPLIVQRHDANGNLYVGPADTLHDFILLTASDSMAALAGTSLSHPLLNQFVLDSSEAANVESAIQAYNGTIQAFANSNSSRVALVDIYSTFNDFAKTGYVGQGVTLTNSYISGGTFGLDGVHPTSQGYAYVANIFIKAINSHFGSNISQIPISSVPGSIMLGKTASSKTGLPNIHYSDLKPMLQLIQRRNW